MANAGGFTREAIWRDRQWRQLSRSAQALYLQLLSQKELDCAGVLPLQPNKWAKGCAELTVEQVWRDLDELQLGRFVFYDTDTDETLVRTYMRNSNVTRVPNMMKSALRAALLLGSELLKPVLADELRATGREEAIRIAEQINPSGNPSETLRVTLPKPFAKPTGVGVGMGVGVTLVTTSVGEVPPQFCDKHPNGTEGNCFACGQARRTYPERKATWDAERKAATALARQAAIDACPICDEFGDITFDDAVRKCRHSDEEIAHG